MWRTATPFIRVRVPSPLPAMIVKGSLNYTTSGRKRKAIRATRKVREFKELKILHRAREEYPSAPLSKYQEPKQINKTLDKTYTIAPAYNKGAYQVIPQDNIKDIGK